LYHNLLKIKEEHHASLLNVIDEFDKTNESLLPRNITFHNLNVSIFMLALKIFIYETLYLLYYYYIDSRT
jgi:hypothetical protein